MLLLACLLEMLAMLVGVDLRVYGMAHASPSSPVHPRTTMRSPACSHSCSTKRVRMEREAAASCGLPPALAATSTSSSVGMARSAIMGCLRYGLSWWRYLKGVVGACAKCILDTNARIDTYSARWPTLTSSSVTWDRPCRVRLMCGSAVSFKHAGGELHHIKIRHTHTSTTQHTYHSRNRDTKTGPWQGPHFLI
jgi:hypothetical protein